MSKVMKIADELTCSPPSAGQVLTAIDDSTMQFADPTKDIATPNGSTWKRGYSSELIALSTSGLTTDSSANLLPADSIIEAVVARTKVAIAGGANAQGTITLTGQPSAGVKSQGTVTLTGVPSVGAKAQGTITLAGVPNGAIAAQGTITLTGLPVADETFVIGSQTFTWKASRASAGQVTIGASADDCTENIMAAVNADIANAVASLGAGATVIITATAAGTAGNSIVFTEASSNLTVNGSGTLGATRSGAAAETFRIDSQTFTWVTLRGGAGQVTLGASAAACVTNIIAAITADLATVVATAGAGTTVVVTAASIGTAGNALVFTESSANLTIDGSGTLGATTSGAAADTFRVGAQTFTWKAARSTTGDVAAGADAAACVANIVTAITADLATVTAAAGAGTTVVVTAATPGAAGDSIVFTESSANLTINGSGTLGATTAGVAPDTFVVDSQTFTIKAARAVAGEVALGGSTAATCTNIINAINLDVSTVTATQGAGTTAIVAAHVEGSAGNSIVFTESLTNATVDGTGTLGGTSTGAGCTGFQIGDGTVAARFAGTDTTLTANHTKVCLAHVDQTGTSGPKQTTAAKLRITAVTAPPDAGSIFVEVFYRQFTAPTA